MVYALLGEWLSIKECRDLIEYSDEISSRAGLEKTTIALYSTISTFIYDEYLWNSYLTVKTNCFQGTIISNIDYDLKNIILGYDNFKKLIEKHIQQIAKSRKNYLIPFVERTYVEKNISHLEAYDKDIQIQCDGGVLQNDETGETRVDVSIPPNDELIEIQGNNSICQNNESLET